MIEIKGSAAGWDKQPDPLVAMMSQETWDAIKEVIGSGTVEVKEDQYGQTFGMIKVYKYDIPFGMVEMVPESVAIEMTRKKEELQ